MTPAPASVPVGAPRALVVAKAPVPGEAKTRLAAAVGPDAAAHLAAAALLDTVDACTRAYGPGRCHLALAGALVDSPYADDIGAAVTGWHVFPQRGEGFAERLVAAHADAREHLDGGGSDALVVQVGMDTPQLTPDLLHEVASGANGHDAVLGPADDGGWWVLALRDPTAAEVLSGVPMSRPDTGRRTRTALAARGLRVGEARVLRDVDTADDAASVARETPGTRFAHAWRRYDDGEAR